MIAKEEKYMGNRKTKTISISVASSCLILSLLIAVLYLFFIKSLDEEEIDTEYAYYTLNQEITTKKYNIQECDTVKFFGERGCKTKFPNAVPNLKIVNDEAYYVEVTANGDLQEMLDIYTKDGRLFIACKEQYYKSVYENDTSYDYDYGIYVDCTKFDIVVYAPISRLVVDTQLTLDFDVAPAKETYIKFSYDGVEGSINNIQTENLNFYCSGTSDLKLDGEVTETAKFMIFHNCHIDAKSLSTNKIKADVSRQLGGFSYIKVDKWYMVRCTNFYDFSNVIELFVYGSVILWTIFDIVLICKTKRKAKAAKNIAE